MTTTDIDVFRNKHNTPRHREIAEGNTILRARAGSELYGVSVDDGDGDRDEMGVCIEPPECVIGLEEFDQWQYRTKPEGQRSGAGDLDLTIYSLRKWARLAAQGNPEKILMLFVPEDAVIERALPIGWDLQQRAELFISRQCGYRFLGYLKAQKEQMLGMRGKHTNRPELIDQFGLDTKFAYHALRLGLQGIELLENGTITLPMEPEHREFLLDVRLGKWTKEQVIDEIEGLESALRVLTDTADIPERADYEKLNRWLADAYQDWWTRKRLT